MLADTAGHLVGAAVSCVSDLSSSTPSKASASYSLTSSRRGRHFAGIPRSTCSQDPESDAVQQQDGKSDVVGQEKSKGSHCMRRR